MFIVIKHIKGTVYPNIYCFCNVTEPNPPQNLTVTAVTSSQIALCWSAPDSTHNAQFEHFILHWVDLVSGRGHAIGLDKMNRSAVIGGLKAYHAHRITVVSVTAQGVESSDSLSVTVTTGIFCNTLSV